MMKRLLLLIAICTVSITAPVYAETSLLKLSITPLDCTTDAVNDGLHINVHASPAICEHANPQDHRPDITLPEQATKHTGSTPATVTGASNTATTNTTPATTATKIVEYHATVLGFTRQSVLRTIVISLGTMSTVSLAAFVLRFFLP